MSLTLNVPYRKFLVWTSTPTLSVNQKLTEYEYAKQLTANQNSFELLTLINLQILLICSSYE